MIPFHTSTLCAVVSCCPSPTRQLVCSPRALRSRDASSRCAATRGCPQSPSTSRSLASRLPSPLLPRHTCAQATTRRPRSLHCRRLHPSTLDSMEALPQAQIRTLNCTPTFETRILASPPLLPFPYTSCCKLASLTYPLHAHLQSHRQLGAQKRRSEVYHGKSWNEPLGDRP